MMEGRCKACNQKRSFDHLGVRSIDVRLSSGPASGVVRQNFQYCLDKDACVAAAGEWKGYWTPPEEEKPEAKKKILINLGFALETDDPEGARSLLIQTVNEALTRSPLRWMGDHRVVVTHADMKEVTPKMMKLAEAVMEAMKERLKEKFGDQDG